jgi:hypothetical protein
MHQLIFYFLLSLLGLVLHTLMEIYEQYKQALESPDENDEATFWKTWKRKKLVLTLISAALTFSMVTAIYFLFPDGSIYQIALPNDLIDHDSARQLVQNTEDNMMKITVFCAGFMLDSMIKKFKSLNPSNTTRP